MMEKYNESYFKHGLETNRSLYTNYRWLPELTIPLAHRLIGHLKITEEHKILDYGCAMGYLVKAFRLLGVEAYGYDISYYAYDNAPNDVKEFLYDWIGWADKKWDFVIAKDVLEHVERTEMDLLISRFSSCAKEVLVIVPVGDGKKYYEELFERDKTHIIREDLPWWIQQFEAHGFECTFYGYKMKGIKENWTTPKANGFMRFKNTYI